MRQNDNVKYRVMHMLSRLKKPNCQKNSNSKSTTSDWYKDDENVVYIKNKITLKDSVNGTEFDVEMDLKVEIEDPDQICKLQMDGDDSSLSGSKTKSRRRSKSCGRGVRHALAERICRPLFGGSTSRLDRKESPTNDKSSINSNSCGTSCISAPWKKRLKRRQLKYQEEKKESLSRSKSLDLPRQKELDHEKGICMFFEVTNFIIVFQILGDTCRNLSISNFTLDDLEMCSQNNPVEVGQQVFQSALKEFDSIMSIPNTPKSTNRTSETARKSSLTSSENSSKLHPNLTRVMSEHDIGKHYGRDKRSGSNPSLELRRLYRKKTENSPGDTKPILSKSRINKKGEHGYSTNDLISFARQQPILSQKSYKTLSKSQAELFRITAV